MAPSLIRKFDVPKSDAAYFAEQDWKEKERNKNTLHEILRKTGVHRRSPCVRREPPENVQHPGMFPRTTREDFTTGALSRKKTGQQTHHNNTHKILS